MSNFQKYEQLRAEGKSPREAFLEAKRNGLDGIAAIRMLRQIFGLSLEEAKRASQAADPFEAPQAVAVGGLVFWEGADTIEGPWLAQARVIEVCEDYAVVAEHKKFMLSSGDLIEVPPSGLPDRIPLRYFEKSLAGRLRESSESWRVLAGWDLPAAASQPRF